MRVVRKYSRKTNIGNYVFHALIQVENAVDVASLISLIQKEITDFFECCTYNTKHSYLNNLYNKNLYTYFEINLFGFVNFKLARVYCIYSSIVKNTYS